MLQESPIYSQLMKTVPSLKLTFSPLKIGLPNRKVVFQPSICRGYVSFRESNLTKWIQTKQLLWPSNIHHQLHHPTTPPNTQKTQRYKSLFTHQFQVILTTLRIRFPLQMLHHFEDPKTPLLYKQVQTHLSIGGSNRGFLGQAKNLSNPNPHPPQLLPPPTSKTFCRSCMASRSATAKASTSSKRCAWHSTRLAERAATERMVTSCQWKAGSGKSSAIFLVASFFFWKWGT